LSASQESPVSLVPAMSGNKPGYEKFESSFKTRRRNAILTLGFLIDIYKNSQRPRLDSEWASVQFVEQIWRQKSRKKTCLRALDWTLSARLEQQFEISCLRFWQRVKASQMKWEKEASFIVPIRHSNACCSPDRLSRT
jgi:hypothetical protein